MSDKPPPPRDRSGLVVPAGWVLTVVVLGILLTAWAIYAIVAAAR